MQFIPPGLSFKDEGKVVSWEKHISGEIADMPAKAQPFAEKLVQMICAEGVRDGSRQGFTTIHAVSDTNPQAVEAMVEEETRFEAVLLNLENDLSVALKNGEGGEQGTLDFRQFAKDVRESFEDEVIPHIGDRPAHQAIDWTTHALHSKDKNGKGSLKS